ncbi:translation elongation factor 2 (EF-2/EF-G) [Actinomadura pelletieri DSM 43383]|uniref:Elongation factor G-like protein n=1 Tax=Actinomadura pelletieri DSM 43383 TaxID=1120940 RepID=A0A495Q966_9ACTN|nr:elongation factor G-like protein EF-G2 [Actinomadura pelletieri]RKS67807.1 translation elongation factor 2 (EF-2/EF-G) [Actinomadura pelletieri DSM 43383]
MADKGGHSGAPGRAPEAGGCDKVRNVALVGHSGAGKTTLVEALLAATGTLQRAGKVEDGTTVSDYDEVEVRQQRSVNLTLAPFSLGDIKVNLIDTPGYADFVGDLRAGLRAADAALFVISAVDGIDGLSRMLWEECAAVGMPRAVVITKVDQQRGDFDDVVMSCQDVFGEGVAPLYFPVSGGDGLKGLIGLLTQRCLDYSNGQRTECDPDPRYLDQIAEQRATLIEGIIQESEDESLMDRYLSGEDIDVKALIEDLETAVARGSFYPVLATSVPHGDHPGPVVGMQELLEVITQAFPSPLEHGIPSVNPVKGGPPREVACDPDGPLIAEVIKTTSDPYVGRISLVRVFSGTLRPDMTVHVSGHGMADRGHEDHDVDERVGALTSPLGKTQRTISSCGAGDICAVAKLTRAESGDTLSDPGAAMIMAPWSMPDPLLPVAIRARSKADEDKLSQALGRLVAEDPTLRLENNSETRQLVLWCMGEAHADVLIDRLRSRYGVEVERVELRVPLRETFGGSAKGLGRHVKQSGGHGQYGICHIDVEPLPSGEGFEFVDKIVGGVIPRQFIPSVEKGVRQQMARGVSAGYPLVDIKVTLHDGKAHSVDSSDMAFQAAGALALKDAASQVPVLLLEPVDEVDVLVADEYVGPIMSDLSSRRGRVLGSQAVPGGRTMIKAEVPQLEIVRYAIDLRSMSQGTGTFSRAFLRYEPLPSHLADKVAAESKEG